MHGVCWGYWNLISIHAPPRGATNVAIRASMANLISIHAPPRGATPLCHGVAVGGEYFNSRPSARGDGNLARSITADIISIHAPPRGATTYDFDAGTNI